LEGSLTSVSASKEDPGAEEGRNILPNEEAIRRLRSRAQPIRLFGESDRERRVRLRALELMEERTEGQQNDFARTLESLDSGLDLAALRHQVGKPSGEGRASRPQEKEDASKPITLSLFKSNKDEIYILIYLYLKRLLREWEARLDGRPGRRVPAFSIVVRISTNPTMVHSRGEEECGGEAFIGYPATGR
jgi:pre-mRNA-splicing factor 18